jgi:hypothetical protein
MTTTKKTATKKTTKATEGAEDDVDDGFSTVVSEQEMVSLETLLVKVMKAGLITKFPVSRAGDVGAMVDFARKGMDEKLSMDVLLLCLAFVHIAGGPLTQVAVSNRLTQHLPFLRQLRVDNPFFS